jgi:hypothetical protein
MGVARARWWNRRRPLGRHRKTFKEDRMNHFHRRVPAALALAVAAVTAHAQTAPAPKASAPSGSAVSTAAKPAAAGQLEQCEKRAGDRTGDARKTFLKSCLTPASNQQNRMKQCNVDAKGKKGDERKAFMSECLRRKKS